MTRYQIANRHSAEILGIFEGENEGQAVAALYADVNYKPADGEDWSDELLVVEVPPLSPITREDLDKSLVDDLDGDAAEVECYEGRPWSKGAIHIAFVPSASRAGLVYVGDGSSGHTDWTEASSPKEALDRYLTDDMRA